MVALLVILVTLASATQPGASIIGTVLDPTGAPVPNASVRLEASGATVAEYRTGNDGRFAFTSDAQGNLRIVVSAPGFAQAMASAPAAGESLQVTLQPAPFFEAVNVTSSRGDAPRADPTVTMTVISSSELLTSAAVTLDDALKMVPGFTLFRRTSSRTANPTAQGVALRGIGGTAQSRSLVLVDGVPLNDAFGGWIYWDKIPQVALDRVEVQRGSGSDLYGADAVGGVVQLLTQRPGRPSGTALIEGGGLGTGRASLFAGGRTRGWRYSASGEWFNIDGYIPVSTEQDPGIAPRGPVDSLLGSTHLSGYASTGYQAPNGWRFDVVANVFDEDRTNGTPQSINSTQWRQGSGEVAGAVGGGLLSARGFGGTQDYRQTFTTVNATRTAETLIRDQSVPSMSGGLGGQWFRAWGAHSLLVGSEARYIDGTSVDTPYAQGQPLPIVEVGGTQRLGSAFVQDTWRPSDRLTIALGAHGDVWHSESGQTGFSKSSGSFNPRASASYRLGESGVIIRGAAFHGFRAPTLNELYRNISVGNTQTRPNEALEPERLTGGDVGVMVTRGRFSARATGFWNVLDEAITAITLSTTPTVIIKQRANADTVHASGLELEASMRLSSSLSATFAGGFIGSTFQGDTSLNGNEVPQVPDYNLGIGVRYTPSAWSTSAQLRITGPQFEDDQNIYTLRQATVLDVFVGRTFARGVTAFVAVENLFNATYDVGRTPVLTTGLPRAGRAGVRIALP